MTTDKAVFEVQMKRYWMVHVFPICIHAEKAAVLSEALQACILWILVVRFMFTDRISVVTPSYWG